MELKQFIPQEYCLRCEVCCRFPEQHSVWAPKFTHDEIIEAVEMNKIPPLFFTQPRTVTTNSGNGTRSAQAQHRNAQRIHLVQYGQGFRCPCFAPHKNKCLIYSRRPFECQLYPFLLLEKDGQFFLAEDMKCPYVKSGDTNTISAYKQYLQVVFKKKEYKSFLSQNRDLFSEYYSQDLDIVFPISLKL